MICIGVGIFFKIRKINFIFLSKLIHGLFTQVFYHLKKL